MIIWMYVATQQLEKLKCEFSHGMEPLPLVSLLTNVESLSDQVILTLYNDCTNSTTRQLIRALNK